MTVHPTRNLLVSDHRVADHPVEPLFMNRWSPRAFDGSTMPEADLKSVLEAARWASSAYNIQPWRFVYALRGDANWDKLLNLLIPFNQSWAKDASALVYLFSDTMIDNHEGETVPAGTNSFDAGGAWAHAALQATALGYHAHAMAGIEAEKIPAALEVPERFKPEIAFAIGRQGEAANLPEGLQDKEIPSPRKPLCELAFSGSFKA